MSWLAEILFELLSWLIRWPGHWGDSRSAVGESDLDRQARRLWIWCIAVVLAIAAAIGLWLHFRH